MIAFGIAVTQPETYDRFAVPGIERASEPDSVVVALPTAGSLFRNYNLVMDEVSSRDDLEALVLLHQDVELVDPDFPDRIRKAIVDPDVAVVGCVGAVGVRSIAWWQGAITWASITHRYEEHLGGEFPAMMWEASEVPSYAAPGEVDSLDGLVIVLSAWAVRNLRFDESLGKLHGYDFDICMQAKAAGKKVVTADFRAVHHRNLQLIADPQAWIAAYIRLVEKWQHLFPDSGADPERRALHAEADAACARALMVSHQYRATAISRHLQRANDALSADRDTLHKVRLEVLALREAAAREREDSERMRAELEEVRESRSWRMTSPLRRLRGSR